MWEMEMCGWLNFTLRGESHTDSKDGKTLLNTRSEEVLMALFFISFLLLLSSLLLFDMIMRRCRHCQDFASSYNNVAATFHSSPSEGIRVAKVDCKAEKALKTRFGVASFPSFFVVDGWSVYEFNNLRSEAALMDFVRGGYKKQEVRRPRSHMVPGGGTHGHRTWVFPQPLGPTTTRIFDIFLS